jgi:hypothetical protein
VSTVAPKDLNGAHESDHVRVELHTRADSKLSGRVTSRTQHSTTSTMPEQSQPRFYQGDLQRDKSGHYWVTHGTLASVFCERFSLNRSSI